MKTFAKFLGGALALLSMAPALAAGPQAAGIATAAVGQSISSPSPISEDTQDNEDGDNEGNGVVDPVPQDDGSPGVEDDS
jgi:hypothetical protein